MPNGPPLLPLVVPKELEKPVDPEVVNGDVPREVEKVDGAEDCWKVEENGRAELKDEDCCDVWKVC